MIDYLHSSLFCCSQYGRLTRLDACDMNAGLVEWTNALVSQTADARYSEG